MRITLVLLPLALTGAPAFAQAAAPAAPAQPVVQIPPVLADPATADRLADTMQSLSSALLNLPVGEVQAAIEGRKATAADRRRQAASRAEHPGGQPGAPGDQRGPPARSAVARARARQHARPKLPPALATSAQPGRCSGETLTFFARTRSR